MVLISIKLLYYIMNDFVNFNKPKAGIPAFGF